ncbi:unnamed protein product [Camellia sinensis]
MNTVISVLSSIKIPNLLSKGFGSTPTKQLSMASSVPSSSRSRCTYDVFLSFRGEETHDNFVSHLYAALAPKGIHTFKDDEKLERGKSISPKLWKAIQESRFSIVVFSKNYASSRWCLDELVEILECSNTTVYPIFYHVNPSDVRRQRGSFGGGFEELVSKQQVLGMEKVQRNTGTKNVEGIVVEYPDLRSRDPKGIGLKELKLRPKAFAKMLNLRILKICWNNG